MKAFIVVGLGFGDEGKGATVDYLTRYINSNLTIRFSGGAQCGHNVVLPNGTHHCFSQFGSGTFAGARTHLSRFVIVNPITMISEAKHLQSLGVDPWPLLTVEEGALVTTPFHIAANRITESARDNNRHGSCGMGVGDTVADSLLNPDAPTFHLYELKNPDALRNKLLRQQEFKRNQVERIVVDTAEDNKQWNVLNDPGYVDRIIDWWKYFLSKAAIVDANWLQKELAKDQNVVFEGAQGVLLDQDYGFQPHTTWTDITFRNAYTLLGDYKGHVNRIGVMRAYQTRHGAGPLVTESEEFTKNYPEVLKDHNIPNDWQGNFRVGCLDIVATQYALDVLGGVDWIAMTCLDKLHDYSDVPMCYAYARQEVSKEDNILPIEFFDSTRRIHVKKPWSLEHQENLTKELYKIRPESFPLLKAYPSPDPYLYANRVVKTSLNTEAELCFWSTGPTYADRTCTEWFRETNF